MLQLEPFYALSQTEWIAHLAVFVINIGLLIFAKPLVSAIEHSASGVQSKTRILQFINLIVLGLHLFDILLISANVKYEYFFVKIGITLVTLYLTFFLNSLFAFFSRKRFGSEKKIDDKVIYFDTYSSRLINLLIIVALGITAIYTLIKLWGADSMLETTGIFGIFVAFLAFTSSAWAPDIISGLIILNSQLLEDGDVVMIAGSKDEYIINKVSLVYVILYDVRNNHRTLIKNSQFLQSKIENLSRIASIDGIRQRIKYNIGYPTITANNPNERRAELDKFCNKIDRMFTSVNTIANENDSIKNNPKRDFEWAMTQTGDDALEFTLWVYLERLPNTKITQVIRSHLMGSLNKINHLVLREAIAEGVDLSTPDLIDVNINRPEEVRAS